MKTLIFLDSLNYLDPATSSYIVQAIIAAGVTVGIFFKNIKFALLSIINKYRKKSE